MRPLTPTGAGGGAGCGIGDYVRSLSDRNRPPRTGSGGAPAERYVRSSTTSTTSTTSRQSIILPRPKTDPQRTVDAGVVAAHTSSCRLRGVVNHRAGPSDLSCRPRARLLGPLSSLKDARAASFLSPVAPLTFQPRRSRLMSFRSYILSASTWRGQPSRRLHVNEVTAQEPRTLTPRASHNRQYRGCAHLAQQTCIARAALTSATALAVRCARSRLRPDPRARAALSLTSHAGSART